MNLKDPFTSPAKRKAMKEQEARIRKLKKWGLGVGIGLVVIGAFLYFTVFSGGGRPSNRPLTEAELLDDNIKQIELQIATGNANNNDPASSKEMKDRWQKDLAILEKQRDELIKKKKK